MHDFRKLKLWQQSIDLAKSVYQLMLRMPNEEKYGLTSQIKRSSISIASNVAEGSGRDSDKDFARFLLLCLGSANELETQLILANELNLLQKQDIDPVILKIHNIQKMTYALIKKLRTKHEKRA